MKVEPEEMTILKSPVNDEQDVDIDLTDPGVQSAATKIQAGFRGMQTRQHLLKPRQVCSMTDSIHLNKIMVFLLWPWMCHIYRGGGGGGETGF